jgi:hypothetical protein
MNAKVSRTDWMRTLGNFSYVLAVAFLIASLAVNAFPTANAHAAPGGGGSDCSAENTDGDNVFCVNLTGNSGSWTVPSGGVITEFRVKAGASEWTYGSPSFPSSCYSVTLSATSVSWSKVGADGPDCQKISHVEIYYDPGTPPTNTPTNTPVDATATPTNTPEDPAATPSSIPANPTVTPTDNPGDPTATPTNTPEKPHGTETTTPAPDSLTVSAFCGANSKHVNSWKIANSSADEVAVTWQIQPGGAPADDANVPANGEYEFSTVKVTDNDSLDVYFDPQGQQFAGSAQAAQGCTHTGATPNPAATFVPAASSGQAQVLIPVTGANLNTGGSLRLVFFNLGIGFLGLGLVLNGLARERKNWDL